MKRQIFSSEKVIRCILCKSLFSLMVSFGRRDRKRHMKKMKQQERKALSSWGSEESLQRERERERGRSLHRLLGILVGCLLMITSLSLTSSCFPAAVVLQQILVFLQIFLRLSSLSLNFLSSCICNIFSWSWEERPVSLTGLSSCKCMTTSNDDAKRRKNNKNTQWMSVWVKKQHPLLPPFIFILFFFFASSFPSILQQQQVWRWQRSRKLLNELCVNEWRRRRQG